MERLRNRTSGDCPSKALLRGTNGPTIVQGGFMLWLRNAHSKQSSRSTASLIVLASTAGVSGGFFLPGTGWAQCNTSSSPAPAAAPPVVNFSNMTFAAAPPLAPYVLSGSGVQGCDGASTGADNGAGGNGFPGQ